MKKLIVIAVVAAFFAGCKPDKPAETSTAPGVSPVEEIADEGKGIGPITEVKLNTPLEQERVGRGKSIYEMKCQPCHRLDDQRVVGPGWKGVTQTRKPEWIMNMILNVEVMLDQDPEAQKLLELCLTRMPNQNVSVGDARDVLEFMRSNDGEQ